MSLFDIGKKLPVIERKKFGDLLNGQLFRYDFNDKIYVVEQLIGMKAACQLNYDGSHEKARDGSIRNETVVSIVAREDLIKLKLLKS